MLKGALKSTNGFVQLIVFFAIIFCVSILASIFTGVVVGFKCGGSLPDALRVLQNINEYPSFLREFLFISQLGTFVFPPLIAAYLYSENYKAYLYLDTPVNRPVLVWTIVSMIVVLPALNLITQLNQNLSFPEALKGFENWLRTMDEAQARQMEAILRTDSVWAYVYNILVIAVFAAVGEELTFRGVLQNICGTAFRNKHVVIWVVAIIFSGFHLQFFGFVPRVLLGAYLGYLLYYTKNIWIPMAAHFTNNFIGVTLYRIYQDNPSKLESIDSLGYGSTWYLSVASIALFVFAFRQIKKYNQA
jgi:membrane protease YdiL (CAAX protease family)